MLVVTVGAVAAKPLSQSFTVDLVFEAATKSKNLIFNFSYLHKVVGVLICFLSCLHTLMHLINFGK